VPDWLATWPELPAGALAPPVEGTAASALAATLAAPTVAPPAIAPPLDGALLPPACALGPLEALTAHDEIVPAPFDGAEAAPAFAPAALLDDAELTALAGFAALARFCREALVVPCDPAALDAVTRASGASAAPVLF
jgi:hypothetical protein